MQGIRTRKRENSTTYCDIKLKMVDKKVVETRYAHDSWGITICCGRLLRGGVD